MTSLLQNRTIEVVRNQLGAAPILILVAIIGIVSFLAISSFAPFKNSLLTSLFPKNFGFAATVTNLLSNGDFESDMTGWTPGSWTISTAIPISGTKFAHTSSSSTMQHSFSGLKPNTDYKVTFWVRINPQTTCTSDCWGYFRGTLDDFNNQFTGQREVVIFKDATPLGEWVKKTFTFATKTNTSGNVKFGSFAGSGWTWNVDIDDVKLFEVPATPIPPTASISANKTSISSVTDTINFTSQADDPDGMIDYFWDFGDGGHSNLSNPTYQYSSNGVYNVTLTVSDESGQSAQASTTISVNDPTLPSLVISNPASAKVDVTSSTVTLSGSASAGSGKTITKVEYSNDRTGTVTQATGTTGWTASLNLTNMGGFNKILVTAYDSGGNAVSKNVVFNYKPTGKIDIQNGAAGISQNNSNIELYDKFEATFNVINSQYSNPDFPYDTSMPPGMPNGLGATIEATFTSPSGKTYKQPGFIYQPFTRNTSNQTVIATGSPVWKIRFSPTEPGNWSYSVSLADASGNTIVSGSNLKFNATSVTNPNNHGFLQVSPTDKRYFQFSDGTPFIGVGPSAVIGSSFSTDSDLAKIGDSSANFSRTWMNGSGVAGGGWIPWQGGLGNDGNVPNTGLVTEQTYGNQAFSLKLTPTGPSCAFYGWQPAAAAVKQNTNYRISVRLKTIGITGSGGFTVRPVSPWNSNPCTDSLGKPLVFPYQKGTQDWHVVTSSWNSGTARDHGILLLVLENVTAGNVYLDEVSIREDLGNGNFGPEVLRRSKFNVQNYFGSEASWNWDYGLDQFAQKGIYEKLVIEEKQDQVFNRIGSSGFGFAPGNMMGKPSGASLLYQQNFWRYLIARWGYSRAIHSFEYVNEEAPGSLTFANLLAKYMQDNDPNKHMANTSFWCCIGNYFQDPNFPNVSYGDTHSYVAGASGVAQETTSWLGTTDPFTGGSMVNDSALYSSAHSIDQFNKNAGGNKPMVVGEAGITLNSTVIAGQGDSDIQGVWWHQFIWPQINQGGAYFIYWYDQSLRNRSLYNIAIPYRKFMEGQSGDPVNKRIPLANGKYANIQLTLPIGINGWGQKDTTNGGAHFWIYDQGYTWTTPTGGSALGGKQVSFSGLPAKQYAVEFWDTWSGNVVQTTNINHVGGTMTLTVPSTFTGKDVAVKIFPVAGYPSSLINPTPAPSIQPSPSAIPSPSLSPSPSPAKPGDIDGNNKVDIFDYNILLTNFGKTGSGIQGDLDGNNKVDIFDYNILLTNFGK